MAFFVLLAGIASAQAFTSDVLFDDVLAGDGEGFGRMNSVLHTFTKLQSNLDAFGWGAGEADRMLAFTNKLRACNGAPPLVWDPKLATNALNVIKFQCPSQKGCSLTHPSKAAGAKAGSESSYNDPSGPAGENLAYASASSFTSKGGWVTVGQTPEAAAWAWYSEIKDCGGTIKAPTATATGSVSGGARGACPGSGTTGHYTALIWKTATRLGCARSQDGQSTICRYGGGAGFGGCNMAGLGTNTYAANLFPVSGKCQIPVIPSYS